MHAVDLGLIIAYLAILLLLGLFVKRKKQSDAAELILGGRRLTLPAFVASLVSTWYGGILGVGEYSYSFGISNWLVFGVPYYLAALIFALFLAEAARRKKFLTIGESLAEAYDNRTALAGSVIIFLMTVPAAYVLMLGVLCQYLFGWPFWLGICLGTFFSIIYVFVGGFKAVVRTDLLQFVLMFLGFTVLFVYLYFDYGGYEFLKSAVPETHFTWHGGNAPMAIAVWYVIAMATLIEPAFYQRCFATASVSVGRRGILLSIMCWMVFDFLTTTCGLYARAILPDLGDPVASFPALAMHVLPVGLSGLFALALISTIMSTVDSYSFLAATTFGNDIMPRLGRKYEQRVILFTRVGLVLSTVLAVVLALYFRSVVEIWKVFGSIGTAALLIPVFTSFVGRRRLPAGAAFASIIICAMITIGWYLTGSESDAGNYLLNIEPIFPGILLSLIIYAVYSRSISETCSAEKND